jgi:DNA helicase II / ATP-dependent DNA helicase PcrA
MQLNTQQLQAVTSTAREILCIAGPGSGKTRVLTERIECLIEGGGPIPPVPPRKIVAITFTTAAAREIEVRLREWRPTIALGYLGTLHGFALRLLNEDNARNGFPPFTVLDEQAATALLEECITGADYKGTAKELKAVLKAGPGEHLKAKHLSKAEIVASVYFRIMRQTFVIDFDRILHFALERLRARKLSTPFDHILVDEFQDSGDIDAAIYRHLEIPNKFYVGDPRQSIYSFRGGNVRHIIAATAKPSGNVEIIELARNYRCASPICGAANRLLENSQTPYGTPTVSATGIDGEVLRREFPDETAEARAIATSILEYPQEKWNEIAILVRTNYEVREWEKRLGIFALPTRTAKPKTLPHDWTITRLFLSLLANPENNATAQRFIELTQGVEVARKLASKAKLEMRSINKLSLNLPAKMGLLEALGKLEANVSSESRAYVMQIAGALTEGATLAELILALNQEDTRETEEGTGITITTIHKAKGREWDHVFLPGWNEGFFPKGNEDFEDIEEERRIAFVAITRAKTKLEISYCKTRTVLDYATQRPVAVHDREPSRFITEAGL